MNLAEERHRIRALGRHGRGDDPVPDSVAEAIRTIRDEMGEDELRRAVDRLEISPVLTAHPTEARRRTVVETLWRIAAHLERMDDPRLTRTEAAEIDRRLLEEITALWHTDPLRSHAPDPLDEVRAAMALFDETIFLAVPTVYREVDEAVGAEPSGTRPPVVRPFLRWGSWIGGDRDGNPTVTADVTRAAADIAFDHVTRGLEAAARRIARALGVSDVHAPPTVELLDSLREDERRFPQTAAVVSAKFPESSHRRKLTLAAQRLDAARLRHPEGYAGPDELLVDLRLVQRSLAAAGASRVAYGELQNLIWQAETFGFHLASLEIRQHADVHRAALEELAPGISGEAEALDRLEAGAGVPEPRSKTAREALDGLRAMAEIQRGRGAEACRRYVVSFTRSAADVVGVYALARLAVPDGPLALDVVPLFESLADLEAAPRVLDELFALPGMRTWLEARGGRLE